MNDALLPYKALYLKTAKQYLTAMATDLDVLQKKPTDAAAVADFYISAHSMKGQSSAMEFTSTSILCRLLEHIGFASKEGTLVLSSELLTSMAVAVKRLEHDLSEIEKENKEADFSSEIKSLQVMTGIVL